MATLGSICAEFVDCEHKTAPIDECGEYFAVGTPAMKGNVINYAEARRISRSVFEGWTRRLIPKEGDLLFAREAPVGPVVRIPGSENVAPGQRTVLMRVDATKADPAFVFFLLTGPDVQGRIHDRAAGSTVPHLNVPDIKAFELGQLPSLDEQRGIAEVLGALDDKIAANDRLRALARQMSTAVYQQACQRDGFSTALADVCLSIARGGPPRYVDGEGGLMVLNQKCIRDTEVRLDPSRRTDSEAVRCDRVLQHHDILVNSTGTGTLGRVARWVRPETATVDSHVTIVRPRPEAVDPALLGVALTQMESEIEGLAEGSTGQTELSQSQLGAMIVRLPREEQQTAVGELVEGLAMKSLAASNESARLGSLRDALLPELMSGRMRVKDAVRDVEEVL